MANTVEKCRSCEINLQLTRDTGHHELVNAGMYCLLCKKLVESLHHGQHDELSGESLECINCNDYIIYYDHNGLIWKDEIYLDKDFLLIRSIEYSKSTILIGDKEVAELPTVIQFTDAKNLFNKLKTIVVLS